jgi:hypothetical protein
VRAVRHPREASSLFDAINKKITLIVSLGCRPSVPAIDAADADPALRGEAAPTEAGSDELGRTRR